MFSEIFIRNNYLKCIDYLQICCNNKNTQYNRTTKHTTNTLWHKDLIFNNIQIKTIRLPESMSNGISPQEIRNQARKNIEEKAKWQIERSEVEELNKGDMLELKCHLYIQK